MHGRPAPMRLQCGTVLALIACIGTCPAAAAGAPAPDAEHEFAAALVVDLDGRGIRTVDHARQVYFDFDDDGRGELTTWPHSPAAFLVLDRNGDGGIDHGAELFGNFSSRPRRIRAPHGFAALAAFDDDGDGFITRRDRIFEHLRLWTDATGQGRASTAELVTLNEAGIDAIGLRFQDVRRIDASGSVQRRVSSVRVRGRNHDIVELWLAVDGTQSLEWHPRAHAEPAGLPHARGFGPVHDLRPAMAENAALRRLVERYVSAKSVAEADALLDPILWEWTGVSSVHPSARGGSIDARVLGTLEAFIGQTFRGRAGRPPLSARNFDVSELQFGFNRAGRHRFDPPRLSSSPERPGSIGELTGNDEELGLGSFNPSRQSAEILAVEYARLRGFVRAQLMAQTHYRADFRLIVNGYDPRRPPNVGDPAHLAGRLRLLHANRDHERFLDLYCTLAGLTLMGGYDAEAVQNGVTNQPDIRRVLARFFLPRSVTEPPQTLSSAERGRHAEFGMISVACLDLLRTRKALPPPAPLPRTQAQPLPAEMPGLERQPPAASPAGRPALIESMLALAIVAGAVYWSRRIWK